MACTVNPPGFASSTQTTFASSVTLAGVSAASFGASQNSTLTATLASTLAAPVSAVVITAVTGASPAGRHLLQTSAAVAFSVATANATQASSLRSALNATATLSGSLATSLRSSPDPVLSAVTGVVAALPAETNLVLAALPCPAGTFLNGLTQSCDQCAIGLVTTSTGSITCVKCPTGFAWASSSVCVACPANAVTSPNNPAQCACSSGYYDPAFGANLTAPVCKICPLGGACSSGFVGAAKGFWRENTRSDFFYSCREGRCLTENVTGPLSLKQAPLLNASVPANCKKGYTGPLCALCIPGYALQSGKCAPCSPEDAWVNWSAGSKAGLLIGCAIAGLAVVAFAFFQPLSPGLERAGAAIFEAASSVGASVVSLFTCAYCFAVAPAKKEEPGKPEAAAVLDEPAVAEKVPASPPATGGTSRAAALQTQIAAEPAPASVHHPHEATTGSVADARRAADKFQLEGTVASTAGNVSAVAALDGMGDSDDDGGGDAGADQQAAKESTARDDLALMFKLQSLFAKVTNNSKILLNFYQIASTFLKSLDIPWPSIFGSVMARVNVVNLNLVQLPQAACLNPSPSFYAAFNGYTLGLLFAMLFAGVLWALGHYVIGPVALRTMSSKERARRMSSFNSTVLQRALLVLYLVRACPGSALHSRHALSR